MVDIEKMSREYQHASPVSQFRSSAGKFGCDLLVLAELQGKLLKSDAKLAMERSMGTAIITLIATCCLLGSVPVVIFGIASAVAYFFEMETWVSQLAVGCTFSLVSIAILATSLRRFAKTGFQFQRSVDELSKNIEWAKDIFSGVSSK